MSWYTVAKSKEHENRKIQSLATEHNRGLATVFTTFLIIAVTMNFDSVGVVYSTVQDGKHTG